MSEIREFVMREPLFDNHEHQAGFSALQGRADELTYREFVGYAGADVVTAMGPDSETTDVESLPDERFWELWSFVRTTGYGRATERACRAVLGLAYTPQNAAAITAALRGLCEGKDGHAIYAEMLERAGVCGALNDACWDCPTELRFFTGEEHPDSFGQTLRYDDLLVMSSAQSFARLERALDRSIQRLDQLNDALDEYTGLAAEAGRLAAVKCGLPYRRGLSFDNSSYAEAERAFEAVMQGRAAELKPLHDYLFHRFVQRAADFGLPVQFHTGYLAGNRRLLGRGDPRPLIPVLQRYSNVRFDLFHAGWPYSELMGAIGKAFPNVWLDLCWAWAMNPALVERTLTEWLTAVPHNKIFGYGGDTGSPFPMVGYALQAREGIANVLEGMLERAVCDRATAERVARRIMHANAREFFDIG